MVSSESHVTWATSVPILVFIGLSVLDRCTQETDVRLASSLNAPYPRGGSVITNVNSWACSMMILIFFRPVRDAMTLLIMH